MIDVRQPLGMATFYARGTKGPLSGPFHGFVVCKVRVIGVDWDDVLLGPDSQGLPDLRVRGPTRTIMLPPDTSTGYAGFPDVKLEPAGSLRLVVDEMDAAVNDEVGTLTLVAERGFPMEAKEGPLSASCVGVPEEVYAKDARDLATRAAQAIDAAQPPFADIEVERSDASHRKIDAAREAIRKWAWLRGPDSEVVQAAVGRIEETHAAWMRELVEALEVYLGAAPPAAEWRTLPSAKVRASATLPGVLEITARRNLEYDWRTKTLGGLELFILDTDGVRAPPVFVTLTSFGAKTSERSTVVGTGQQVELELSRGAGGTPMAMLVVEGPKVFVMPFRPKQ